MRCRRCGESEAVSEIQQVCLDCLWRARFPPLKHRPDDDELAVAETHEDGVWVMVPKMEYLSGRWRQR